MELFHKKDHTPPPLQVDLLHKKSGLNTSMIVLIVCLALAFLVFAMAALVALGSFSVEPLEWYDLLAIG
ncbi:MAG: hypothetical protein WCY65_05475 [Candidatus Methanomethylophilaceae archaeon]